MSMITMTVQPDDGDPFEVKAGTRDIYVWEKTNRGKTFAELMKNMAIVDLYEIAHIAARRQGLYQGTLRDLVETCEIETELDEEDEDDGKAGPFDQDRSAETSSPSPSSPASRRRSGPKKATGR